MSRISRSKMSLRISGDSLLPDEITKELEYFPTWSQTKGEVITNQNGSQRIAQFGTWRITAEESLPKILMAR